VIGDGSGQDTGELAQGGGEGGVLTVAIARQQPGGFVDGLEVVHFDLLLTFTV